MLLSLTIYPTESRGICEHDLFLRGAAGPPGLAGQGGAGLVQVDQVTGGLQSGQCRVCSLQLKVSLVYRSCATVQCAPKYI